MDISPFEVVGSFCVEIEGAGSKRDLHQKVKVDYRKTYSHQKPLGVVKPSRNSWGEPPNKLSWKPRGQHDQVVIALVVAAVAAILVLVLSLAAVIVIPFPSR